MSNFHPIYSAAYYGAWRVVPKQWQGIHRGGLAPRLNRISQARVAIWCARRVLDQEAEPELAEALVTASAFLDRPDAQHVAFEPADLLGEHQTVPFVPPPDALEVVWRAVDGVKRLRQRHRTVTRRARTCAYLASRVLVERKEYDITNGYILPLDELLLAEELLQFGIRYRQNLRADFESLVYRASLVGHRTDLWLVLFQDATLGLLLKLGRWWKWFEGNESEVLPNIPDDHFASAAESLAGRPTKGV